MRPLEILLWLAGLLALLSLAAPRPQALRCALGLALLALLAAAAQVLAEGARWQMAPAYALAVALFLLALAQRALPRDRPRRPWLARLGVGLGVLSLILAAALPAVIPMFRFPPPQGPYAIGTRTYHWVDQARPETFTANPADRRELMVQVWYPAPAQPHARRAPYLQDGAALAPLLRLLGLPAFLLGHLPDVTTNAAPSAPAAADGADGFPVLLFAHGRGGYRQHNTFQVEALVSHGYVVAALDQPYAAAGVAFPDGRRADYDPRMSERRFMDSVIPDLARDASFALDRLAILDRTDPVLAGRLDLQRAGMFGLSLGGAVTAQACLQDPRLKACLPMDVFMPEEVVRSGLSQPTLWISRDAGTMRQEGWDQAEIDETQSTMRAVFAGLPVEGYLVLLPGAFHPNFSDTPLMTAPFLGRRLGLVGPIDPGRAHEIINAVSLAFFDRHLKGAPAPLLDDPASTYPEVLFQSRRTGAVTPGR